MDGVKKMKSHIYVDGTTDSKAHVRIWGDV